MQNGSTGSKHEPHVRRVMAVMSLLHLTAAEQCTADNTVLVLLQCGRGWQRTCARTSDAGPWWAALMRRKGSASGSRGTSASSWRTGPQGAYSIRLAVTSASPTGPKSSATACMSCLP